jgi:hypothetical protein
MRIVVPEPHYTLFDTTRGELPEVIVVNDSLLPFSNREIFPWHIRVTFEAEDLVENGMPSPAESELLFALGDQVESVILSGRTKLGAENALFVARSTWNATRELRYQVHDPEITHAALQELLTGRDWATPWDYEMKHEHDWISAQAIFKVFEMVRHDA